MREGLFNEQMRQTLAQKKAFFSESRGALRALRCIRMETLRAFSAHFAGQTPGRLGSGRCGDEIEIENFKFVFSPGVNGWFHDAGSFKISLMPTCSPVCAAQWLGSFKNALKQAPGFVHGSRAHHFVGAEQGVPDYVALAEGNLITWFNHPNGFLFATGLAEATKDADHKISTVRFIHHETAHLYEPKMADWLKTLAKDVNRAYNSGKLDVLSEELSYQYLPERIKAWRAQRTASVKSLARLDEDMAAEFLVEAYAHTVIEGKTLTSSGHWQPLDFVIQEMKLRQLDDPPRQSSSPPVRVMILPKSIEVSERLLTRAKIISGRV